MITVLGFRFVESRDATVQPTVRHFHRLLGIGIFRIARSTFVKRHHYVRSDSTLDVHYPLRSEDVLASVDVRTELGAFFAQFADTRQ